MADPIISSLGLFANEEHQPFFWEGGKPAALFIHGFLGTPAEMRPLAQELHQKGWTVQGLLLPGFGSEIDTLFERWWPEWIGAAQAALVALKKQHHPILLVGYSMGAAIAMNVASNNSLDALVLLAPFWGLSNTLQRMIWQVLKRVIRQPQPFKKADFGDPQLSKFFSGTAPDLDLEDPQVQNNLRQLRVPTRFVDQVITVGGIVEQTAAQVEVPILILQGTRDEAVKPERTRQLLQLLPGPINYEELETDHGLVQRENPGFRQMSRSVLAFAETLVRSSKS